MAKPSITEKAYLDNRSCESCGAPLRRTNGETLKRWRDRRFCSLACAGQSFRLPLRERFEAKVDRSPGLGPGGSCHEWTGALSGKGYGAIQINGQAVGAHRVSYSLANGSIPDDLFVLHRCDNRQCVNPDHLFLGTAADNMQDKANKDRCNAPKGEAHWGAKITADDASAIFADERPYSVIAKEYGISYAAVRNIKLRQSWRSATQ